MRLNRSAPCLVCRQRWNPGSPAEMVRLTTEEAAALFPGKTPREIYELAWSSVVKARNARIDDLDDTVTWLVEQGYLTEKDLKAIEEADYEGERNGRL